MLDDVPVLGEDRLARNRAAVDRLVLELVHAGWARGEVANLLGERHLGARLEVLRARRRSQYARTRCCGIERRDGRRTNVEGGRRSTFCLVVRGVGWPLGRFGSVAYEIGVSDAVDESSESTDDDESRRSGSFSLGPRVAATAVATVIVVVEMLGVEGER